MIYSVYQAAEICSDTRENQRHSSKDWEFFLNDILKTIFSNTPQCLSPHPPKTPNKSKWKSSDKKSQDQVYILSLLKKNVSATLPWILEHSQYLLIFPFKLEYQLIVLQCHTVSQEFIIQQVLVVPLKYLRFYVPYLFSDAIWECR